MSRPIGTTFVGWKTFGNEADEQAMVTRVVVGILTVSLAALLVWAVQAGLGNMRLRVILGGGIILGVIYLVLGRLPDWMIHSSGGFIAADDDPDNISPRVYLPILLGVILIGIIGVCLGLWWL